jgi:hypothetical protein
MFYLRNIINAILRAFSNNIPISQIKTLSISEINCRRFKIKNPDGTKWIHFGRYPHQHGTYLDHDNNDIKSAWLSKHSQIYLNRDGKMYKAINYPNSPKFYSSRILW